MLRCARCSVSAPRLSLLAHAHLVLADDFSGTGVDNLAPSLPKVSPNEFFKLDLTQKAEALGVRPRPVGQLELLSESPHLRLAQPAYWEDDVLQLPAE